MWETHDRAAVDVAAKFYEYLLEQNVDTVSSAPRALHRAILDLKAQDDKCLTMGTIYSCGTLRGWYVLVFFF